MLAAVGVRAGARSRDAAAAVADDVVDDDESIVASTSQQALCGDGSGSRRTLSLSSDQFSRCQQVRRSVAANRCVAQSQPSGASLSCSHQVRRSVAVDRCVTQSQPAGESLSRCQRVRRSDAVRILFFEFFVPFYKATPWQGTCCSYFTPQYIVAAAGEFRAIYVNTKLQRHCVVQHKTSMSRNTTLIIKCLN